MKLFSHLLLSTRWAEGEPPAFDPFPGALPPLLAVGLVLLVILAVWWLLQNQMRQVEPVAVGDHGHGADDHHGAAMHAAAPVMTAPAVMEPPAAQAPPAMIPPATPEMIAEPVPAASSTPDDLKKLEGVGPKVEKVLNAAGITTFAQLAGADPARLRQILDAADYAYMDPASWPEQARLCAAGDWDALQKLQDSLKGGR